MSAQHTPGPWFVEDPMGSGPGDHLWIVQEGASSEVYDWRNLAVVCSDDPDDTENDRPISIAERDANARLIAAAPDLLAALVAILGPLNVCSDNPNVRDDVVLTVDMMMGELRQARAAIAKARPQSGEGEEGR